MRRHATKSLFWVVFLLLIPGLAWNASAAHGDFTKVQHEVAGIVTDAATGESLPGVNVIVKGTEIGTSTNAQGRYTLSVTSPRDTLVFSFVGYQREEVSINGRDQINVSMERAVIDQEGLVVVGYGTQERRDLTGSISSVEAARLQLNSPTSIQQGLAGRMAGVTVSQNSGRPGGNTKVRVRGSTTITGSNEPLYVIDDIVLPKAELSNNTSPIDFIDPANIESIDVLKGASASAIYGSRGSNGVVLITTKGGDRESRATYSSTVSLGILANPVDVLNAEEYMWLKEVEHQNADKFGVSSDDPAEMRADRRFFDANGNPKFDTDWQEEGTRTAVSTNHTASFSGGNESTSYRMSLGYRRQQGLLLNSELERYTANLSVSHDINSWLQTGGRVIYTEQTSNQPRNVGDSGVTPTRNLLATVPGLPVRREDGSFAISAEFPSSVGLIQPVRLADKTDNIQDVDNLLGNAFANFKLSQNLDIKSTIGVNSIREDRNTFQGSNLKFVSTDGQASVASNRITTIILTNTLNYETIVGGGNVFSGVLGSSYEKENSFSSSIGVQDFTDDFFSFNNLGNASTVDVPSSERSEQVLNSYFGRLNYSWEDKYLFTFSGRFDGSSTFGENNRFGFFPSGSVAWRASEEKFLRNISAISNLKFRVSYGITGNSDIPPFRTKTRLQNTDAVFNDERATGVGVSNIGNRNLKWEKNEKFNFGIDLGLLDERINMTFDMYYEKTQDMLLDAPIPSSSGFESVFRNIGDMRNKGIEISLETQNINSENFIWETNFNISANRNKVLRLTGGQDIVQGDNPIQGLRIIREGEPVNSFFGFIQQGTWNTDEAEEAAEFGQLPGDRKFKDVNNDGVINDDDRVILGRGTPSEVGSLVNSFRYDNFDLTLDLQFWIGNDVSFDSFGTLLRRTGFSNSLARIKDAWTPENQNTSVQQIRPVGATADRTISSARIFDGSFLRGRSLTLGYTLPSNLLNTLSLENFRIHFAMRNFFVVTSYPGNDPEVATSSTPFDQGTDLYSFPKPVTYELGIDITL